MAPQPPTTLGRDDPLLENKGAETPTSSSNGSPTAARPMAAVASLPAPVEKLLTGEQPGPTSELIFYDPLANRPQGEPGDIPMTTEDISRPRRTTRRIERAMAIRAVQQDLAILSRVGL